jgi:hypothetical protein
LPLLTAPGCVELFSDDEIVLDNYKRKMRRSK